MFIVCMYLIHKKNVARDTRATLRVRLAIHSTSVSHQSLLTTPVRPIAERGGVTNLTPPSTIDEERVASCHHWRSS